MNRPFVCFGDFAVCMVSTSINLRPKPMVHSRLKTTLEVQSTLLSWFLLTVGWFLFLALLKGLLFSGSLSKSCQDIGSTQYLCCMNPTAGSFNVNPRLQRHFWTCSVQFPEQNALNVPGVAVEWHGSAYAVNFLWKQRPLNRCLLNAPCKTWMIFAHVTPVVFLRRTRCSMHSEES